MHFDPLKRRQFITLLAAAWPLATRAQQPAMPVVGFLRSTPSAPFANLLPAFREGLNKEGFVEGRDVVIEQRYADNRPERLPALADDLVTRKVSVIVGNGPAVMAARAATATIPIVFVTGDDPVRAGLVVSLSRPGGNVTGVTFFALGNLTSKRLEILHEFVPKTEVIAVLIDPTYGGSEADLPTLETAARALGLRTVATRVRSEGEFEAAFAGFVQAGAGAILVSGSPFFTSQRWALVALSARHGLPAMYDQRDFVAAGGLVSHAASFTGAYHQAGVYAGRILRGAKVSELPVLQPTMFELAVNLKTAKEFGLPVPPSILLRADEVIE
jgi:putative tryptophan/tyrosine transport system substrate-binding protein